MQQGVLCVYKNQDNFEIINDNFEESEIDKGIDFTSYTGFDIKNCHVLIDSFSIKFTEEEKEKITQEILDFYKTRPNNSFYTYKKQFSYIKENKTYNYQFICVIKKINDEKADIKYGIKEINISSVSSGNIKNEENAPSFWKELCDRITSCFANEKKNN